MATKTIVTHGSRIDQRPATTIQTPVSRHDGIGTGGTGTRVRSICPAG